MWNPHFEHEGTKHHWLPFEHPDRESWWTCFVLKLFIVLLFCKRTTHELLISNRGVPNEDFYFMVEQKFVFSWNTCMHAVGGDE